MEQRLKDQIGAIGRLGSLIKAKFVDKDALLDMLTLCAVAHEHLLIVGPPGTAKSELVKQFALRCSGTESSNGTIPYFEYLLTRFTEPNEIFGPVNVQAFQQGKGQHRVTDGHLPRAKIAFLDEVFKSNSAILNSLLNILNERVFYNGDRVEDVPLLCAIGATNEIPDDTTLAALYDRFLVQVWTNNVDDVRFEQLLGAGWGLEKDRILQGYQIKVKASISIDALEEVHRALEQVELEPVLPRYHEAVRRICSEGIEISDRRAIKLLKLIGNRLLVQRLQEQLAEFDSSSRRPKPQGAALKAAAEHIRAVRRLEGHTGDVLSVSFSPDGRLLASGSDDKTVRLWNSETGQELRCLQGHGAGVLSVSFSPDGRLLASGSGDRTVTLWSPDTGQELRCLQGHGGSVYSVSFSPDGRLLASGSDDQTVRLWNPETGEELRCLRGHRGWVGSVSISPDGGLLASGSVEWIVRLWNPITGQEVRRLESHTAYIWRVSFSPDGRVLVSCGTSGDGTVRIWDADTWECIAAIRRESPNVGCLAISNDGRFLVSGRNTTQMWDISSLECGV